MQVAQAEVLRLVDQDRIGVRDVQAVLDQGRAEHHVVVPTDEIQHPVFQLFGFHLSVRHANLHVRNQAVQDVVDGREFLHFVVQEEDLAAPVEFIIDDALDFLLVEENDFRLDGNAVGRRGVDNAQVARSQQGELQRSRNRSCGQRKGIHRSFEGTEFFFRGHAEFLLLINNQQAQVLEIEFLAKDLVRAYQDIDLTRGKALFDVIDFFCRPQAADEIDVAGQVLQTLLESIVMLQRQDGRRHENRHLLAVASGLEGGSDGDFRFTETDIAADEAVHRAGILHVPLHGRGGRLLIGRIFIHEGRFQFFLQIGVRREGVALGSAPLGIQLNQVLGDILDLFLGVVFQRDPGLGTQFVDFGRFAVLGAETGNLMQRMHRNEDHVAILVGDLHHFPHAAEIIAQADQATKNAYTMVDVHDVISDVEGIQVVDGQLLALLDRATQADPVEAVENLVVCITADLFRLVDEARMDIFSHDKFRQQTPFLCQDGPEPIHLRLFLAENIHPVIVFQFLADIGRKQFEIFVEYRLRGYLELDNLCFSG